jgi:thiaminase (transcriptional activator TenA)
VTQTAAAEEAAPPFSVAAWARARALYEAIRDMPFNRDLSSGQLNADRFQHYIVQDASYLIAFAQALAVAAAKADEPGLIRQFAEGATAAVAVERELHERYFDRFGLGSAEVLGAPMSPTCHHYASFLLATAFREPLPVLAAALLPCFWIYREVGKHILASATRDNPYQAWIDTYSGPDFNEAVDRMIAACDALARPASSSTRDAMHAAFARAVQLEWMFWDAAYRLERWPVTV